MQANSVLYAVAELIQRVEDLEGFMMAFDVDQTVKNLMTALVPQSARDKFKNAARPSVVSKLVS
jgi:methyl coenzyme M reductase subunit C-like uncharacterized protein (methanogenesis marker protein 7)